MALALDGVWISAGARPVVRFDFQGTAIAGDHGDPGSIARASTSGGPGGAPFCSAVGNDNVWF